MNAPRAARAARALLAAVWWYEGLWAKVLGRRPEQRSIVAAVPGLPAWGVTGALVGLGTAETAVGAWVLTGHRARAAALTQTTLLVAMNAGGLAVASDRIRRPVLMLVRNAALLALAWLAARPATRDGHRAD